MGEEQEVKGGFFSSLTSLWKKQEDEIDEDDGMEEETEVEEEVEEEVESVKTAKVEKVEREEEKQPGQRFMRQENAGDPAREDDGVAFFKQSAMERPQVSQAPVCEPASAPVKEQAATLHSDCETFLEAYNKTARSRNETFMQRFADMKNIQMEIDRSLDSIKRNPITLRSMSDFANGVPLETVAAEAARRRGDTFSSDSTSVSASLQDFENQMNSWIRTAQLTLEVAMLAPLPELGRPEMLQKNARIFLNDLAKNQELKIFMTATRNKAMTLHEYTLIVARDIDKVMTDARTLIDRYFGAMPQPIGFNLFEHQKKLAEKQQQMKAAEAKAETEKPQETQLTQKAVKRVGPGRPSKNLEKTEKQAEPAANAAETTEACNETDKYAEPLTDMIIGATRVEEVTAVI